MSQPPDVPRATKGRVTDPEAKARQDAARLAARAAKGFAKVSRAELSERVDIVLDLIVQGAGTRAIYRYVTGKTTERDGTVKAPPGGAWDVSLSTVEKYSKKALVKLATERAPSRAEGIAKARKRYELILARALAAGELVVAERANRSIARLDGLDAPVLTAVAGTVLHEHTGIVEHEHTHRAATIDERAEGVRKLFDIAAERKRRGVQPPGDPVRVVAGGGDTAAAS